MYPTLAKQVVTALLIVLHLQPCLPWWGRRGGAGAAVGRIDRRPCPQVTNLAEANKLSCVSKYECGEVCENKKKCRTKYEYKCTDFKRRECKEVWQNQCNGLGTGKKRGRRAIRGDDGSGSQSLGGGGDFNGRRTPRLIPTEVVYDQSYPLPETGLPFADPVGGQKFEFASPPKSQECWEKVQDCQWTKYKSTCRNQPVKECDDKESEVCEKKCSRVYHCPSCPDEKPTPPPKPTSTSRPSGKPTPSTTTPAPPPSSSKPPRPPPSPAMIGPPAPPPSGTFIIGPPAPPSGLDIVIVDSRRRSTRP